MREVEKTGRTIEEAVNSALSELGVSKEEVEVDVLEEPSKGLLGLIGARPGKVKVRLVENPVKRAQRLLEQVFDNMNLSADMEIEEKEDETNISIHGSDLGILIGRRGETLDALQYLVNLSANKGQENRKKIILDVEGYRKRRETTLQSLAVKLANKAKKNRRNVKLEPMSSQERRIIHTQLQGRDDIYTFSEGEEPYRKVVICPKNKH